jgi:hypothetical protein
MLKAMRRLLRSFRNTLLFFLWGIGIALIFHFFAVLEFIKTQWLWLSLAFIALWGCLFWLARPYRGLRNPAFRTIQRDWDEQEDERDTPPRDTDVPAWVERARQDEKRRRGKAS